LVVFAGWLAHSGVLVAVLGSAVGVLNASGVGLEIVSYVPCVHGEVSGDNIGGLVVGLAIGVRVLGSVDKTWGGSVQGLAWA